MNNPEAHLNAVAVKQLTWKPSVVRNVAVAIVGRIILPPFKLWPDEISLAAVSQEDRQAVGTAWRLLARAEVIQQTGNYRRSNASGRKSSSVFEYQLIHRGRAETFLKRNGVIPHVAEVQSELFAPRASYPNN